MLRDFVVAFAAVIVFMTILWAVSMTKTNASVDHLQPDRYDAAIGQSVRRWPAGKDLSQEQARLQGVHGNDQRLHSVVSAQGPIVGQDVL